MNNTTKHTPGPWRKGVDNTIYQAETNKRIADIYMHAIYRDSDMQAHANAHLIAAAPAMYEALQIMVRAANVDEIDPLVMFASIERAKGALAQAEGRDK